VQLSAVQVAASALASVSAAVVASLFGVTGTVVGAGLVAVISTTGSAIYSSSMKRTREQLRRAREQLAVARSAEARAGRTSARGGSTAVLDQPAGGRTRRGRTIDLTDGADTAAQARSAPEADEKGQSWWRRGWLTIGSRKGLKWPALLGAAVLVFAIAIGVITAVEAITQKPIAALTGHSSSSSTTVGSLTGGSKASATPTPAPTNTGSGSDANENSPAPQVSTTPSSGSTGTTGKGETSTSSAQPSASAAPSSAAPKPSSGSGTTGGTGSGSGSGSGQDIQVPIP
jgi:hypothetical protein